MADQLIPVKLSSSQVKNLRALHLWLAARAAVPAWVHLVTEDLDRTCRIAQWRNDSHLDGSDECYVTSEYSDQPDCSDLDRCKYPDDPDHTEQCSVFARTGNSADWG